MMKKLRVYVADTHPHQAQTKATSAGVEGKVITGSLKG